MEILRKFLSLPRGQRGLLLKAALFLFQVRLGFSLLPFTAFRRLLERALRSDVHPAAPAPSAEQIAEAVASAGRRLPGGRNCLVQALATRLLLHRMGYRASLRIGVRRGAASPLEAHAWLEERGRVLVEGAAPARYAAFPPL